jgi:hypothetical protein
MATTADDGTAHKNPQRNEGQLECKDNQGRPRRLHLEPDTNPWY